MTTPATSYPQPYNASQVEKLLQHELRHKGAKQITLAAPLEEREVNKDLLTATIQSLDDKYRQGQGGITAVIPLHFGQRWSALYLRNEYTHTYFTYLDPLLQRDTVSKEIQPIVEVLQNFYGNDAKMENINLVSSSKKLSPTDAIPWLIFALRSIIFKRSSILNEQQFNAQSIKRECDDILNNKFWYEAEDIDRLMHLLPEANEKNVFICPPFMITQEEAQIISSLSRHTDKLTALVPLNKGGIHWVALLINRDSKLKTVTAIYVDPFGSKELSPTSSSSSSSSSSSTSSGIPAEERVRTILSKTYKDEKVDFVPLPWRTQKLGDSWNCGPWCIEIFRSLLTTTALPAENFDIDKARVQQMNDLLQKKEKEEVATQFSSLKL